MATCIESITNTGVENIPVLFPSTVTPWEATGMSNSLLKIESSTNQTISINVNVTTSPTNTVFTLFKASGSGLTVMGTVNVNSQTASFSFEITDGTFILCIRRGAFTNQSGTLIASFASRPVTRTFPLNCYSGEYCSFELTLPRPERECSQPIFFELMEGEVPPGLILTDLGVIFGELPLLDCLPDNPSPSVGWYETIEGATRPFGREWRFKLKIRTASTKPGREKEAWFCIRIHNNWDIDTENFLAKMPFEKVQQVRVIEETPRLSDSLCVPCESKPADINKFVPKPLNETNCPACDEPTKNVKVDLIEIPWEMCECPVENHLEWYISNKGKTFDNPYIQEFMDRLDNSEAFKILLSKSGYIPEENPNEFAIVNTFDNFLQISVIEPEFDPESYSAMVDQWRLIQNQNLPMVFVARAGESCEANLTKFNLYSVP